MTARADNSIRGGASKSETTFSITLWSLQTAEIAESLIEFVVNVPLKAKKDGRNYILSGKAGTTRAPFPGRPTRAQGELSGTMRHYNMSLGGVGC